MTRFSPRDRQHHHHHHDRLLLVRLVRLVQLVRLVPLVRKRDLFPGPKLSVMSAVCDVMGAVSS